MFSKSTLRQAIGIAPVITQQMADLIMLWGQRLRGEPFSVDKIQVNSLGLEQSIVREFSNVSLNEMTVNIGNIFLEKLFFEAIKDLGVNFQKGLGLGAMVIKPLGKSGVQYVAQDGFIPIKYDTNGKLLDVIFPEIKKISDNNFYIRLEHHTLDKSGLKIENRAFHSNSQNYLGHEVALDCVPEWANLELKILYPKMEKMAFGYYRNPIVNTIDNSFCGVSIFDSALNLIRQTDIQFERLCWEFESGERAIHVDISAVSLSEGKPSLNRLNRRLYRGLNIQAGDGKDLFSDFSPVFREQSIIAGLQEFKREIEFSVGLSYGDISNPQTVEKTATEIISAKKRKYNTVSAIQKNLAECLEDLAYGIAFYNGLATSGYTFICDFKDSILTDEETERKQDKEDVSMGAMGLAEYRSKWYGEPIEEAEKNLPKQVEIIN